jgi:hypothetical protein
MTTKDDSREPVLDSQPLSKQEYIIDLPFKPCLRVSHSEIFYKKKTYSLNLVKHLFFENIQVNQHTNRSGLGS